MVFHMMKVCPYYLVIQFCFIQMFPFPISPSYTLYITSTLISEPQRSHHLHVTLCLSLVSHLTCPQHAFTISSQAWVQLTLGQLPTTGLTPRPCSFELCNWTSPGLFSFYILIFGSHFPTFLCDSLGFSAWFVNGLIHSDLGPTLWNVHPEWALAPGDYVPCICSLVSRTVVLEDTAPAPCRESLPSHYIRLLL